MNEQLPLQTEPKAAALTAKFICLGLGIFSTLAIFGGSKLSLLVFILVLLSYLYSLFTRVPFKQLVE